MVALALNFASSGWPDKIRPHPYWVIALAIVGLILFVLPWLLGIMTGKNDPQTPTGNAAVTAPITNSNQVNPVFAPTFINSNNPSPPPPPTESFRLDHLLDPNVSISSVRAPLVSSNDHIFRFDMTGLPTATLVVENRESDLGSGMARDLIGVIRFSQDGQEVAKIQRGYWLGRLENKISLDIGQSAELIVGQILKAMWFYYDNPRERGLPARMRWSQIRNMAENMQANPIAPEMLALDSHLDVVVNVVSLQSRAILVTRSFRIRPTEDRSNFSIELMS